ncbi:MAG TPA: tetratricopeptide repeat protein [Rudaea sp.]|jgi:DNA-binding winged helix-turn-helix (wHTH) protein/TolB-like protein/tetratricopeptide (TPR) repeat protein|uniref:winged helix-turn-helix domain-containing tetratricopeptide repeat protein n=1 Tax=Rudaea sp. TaxID=2136325 RepID=UPI002F959BDC
MHTPTTFRFGEFTLIQRERLLLRAGQPVALTGKAFDLLVVLVSNEGHLVGKDDLLREVWPGLVVEEVNLSVNISVLRKALADAPDRNGWIETVPRRGYRFAASVTTGEESVRPQSVPAAGPAVPEASRSPVGANAKTDAVVQHIAPPREEASAGKRTGAMWKRRSIIALFTLIAIGAGLTLRERVKSPPSGFTSVAVLPFSSGSAADDYIADGITESIINSLTLLPEIRVTPRASAFRYKSPTVEPGKVGLELHVAAVIMGKMIRNGSKVRIQIDLVDAARDSQIWGANYEGDSGELVHLQGQIVRDVAHELRPALTGEDQQRLAYRATDNPDAYRAYLEARYYWNQRSAGGIKRAIEQFRRSIEIDPNFAMAYSGLADSYTTLGYLSDVTPRDAFPLAKQYALKALALNPSLAEAHASLAYEKFYFEWDWPGADAEFKRAIALNPRYPITHQWYSVYLLAMGRANEALQEIRAAQEYDPLSLAINTDVGFQYYYTGKYEEATKQLQAVLEMNSDYALAHLWLGRTYQQSKRYDDALSEFQKAEVAFRNWPVLVAARGSVDAASGRMQEANQATAELESLSKSRFVTSYGVALIYAGLNEKDAAFGWLEKAFDERSHWLVWLRLDPRWDNLRSDPRFSALVSRMNFPT